MRVSMDEIKEALFDVVGYRDRTWSRQVGKAAWPVFKRFVHLHLDCGENVVADATFLWPTDGAWVSALAESHGVDLYQVWMTADPRVVRDRFIHRANTIRHPGHNDALEHVLEEFEQRFFNRSFIPMPIESKTLIVDTTEGKQANVDEILEFIGE